MNDSNSDLLSQLRIDSSRRDGGEHRHWLWLVLALAVIAVSGGVWVFMQGKAVLVETAVAQSPPDTAGSMAVLDASGYITARRQATVSSKITGKLEEVLIEEGDYVEQDQVLARLDATYEQAQRRMAKAQLEAAKAQTGQLGTQLQQAERDLQRELALDGKGLGRQQALDDAGTRVNLLKAQLITQRKQIQVAEAQLGIAQVNFDNTIIRAPFSGVIIGKAAQPGEIVSPISAGGGYTRTGIGTIVDMDSLEVEVDVNEAFINRVSRGQPVEIILDAYPNWKIPGSVLAIIPAADRAKATIRVRIGFEQKDSRIVPDMGVRVSFMEEAGESTPAMKTGVLIPGSSLVTRDGQNFVYIVKEEQAQRRTVVPGQTYGDLRLIESGLQAGDRVVREPDPGIRDGTKIKLKQ